MAFALTVDVFPVDGGPVRVQHVFYGETEQEVRQAFKQHAEGCDFLGPAIAEDRVAEELEEIDDEDVPQYDVDDKDGEDSEDDAGDDQGG